MLSRRNLYLISSILLISALCFLGIRAADGGGAASLTVSVDGEEVARFDLDRNTEYLITGYGGGVNRLIIRDGNAWIEEASCPDKLCVRQGRISREGEMIICLPNRVTAEIRKGD